MSSTARVLNALQSGKELTARQIRANYNVADPYSVIRQIRNNGYAVYLNETRNSKGDTVNKYRLGTPTRSMVAMAAQMGYFDR
jgi:predicted transcriptional regulator